MSLFLLMGLLTGIDYRSVPIFKNLSVGFCDLVFDPGSRQSIKYGIDTHGLVTRIDLLGATVTCRAAPWDLQQFEAALQLLLALKPILVLSFRLSIDG